MMPPGALTGPRMMMSRAGHTATLCGNRRESAASGAPPFLGISCSACIALQCPRSPQHLDLSAACKPLSDLFWKMHPKWQCTCRL